MNARRPGLIVFKVLLLTVILMFVNGIASQFLPAAQTTPAAAEVANASPPPAQPPASFLGLVFGIMLLQTIALAYPVVRSRWSGWRLAGPVALLYFGTVTFMSQIESLIYLGSKMPEGMLSGLFAMGLVSSVVFAPILVLILGRWRPETQEANRPDPPQPSWSPLGPWLSRALVGGVVFLALYYLFGYYVAWQNPLVREYYGGSDPGSFFAQMLSIAQGMPWMFPVQFARGLLWVGLGLLVVRMMRGGWWESGLAAALLFAVPSLYLLLPNPMMPEPVRMAHLVETVPYQFLFGWVVAWLFRPRAPGVERAA